MIILKMQDFVANLVGCVCLTATNNVQKPTQNVLFTASFVRNCNERSIRLAGGPFFLEGRVELCVNGDWGTVASNNWDYRDASVACRQLGFSPLGNSEGRGPGNPSQMYTLYFFMQVLSICPTLVLVQVLGL